MICEGGVFRGNIDGRFGNIWFFGFKIQIQKSEKIKTIQKLRFRKVILGRIVSG